MTATHTTTNAFGIGTPDVPFHGMRPLPLLMGLRFQGGDPNAGGAPGTGAGAPAPTPTPGTDPAPNPTPDLTPGADQIEGPVGGVEFKDLDPKTQDAVRALRKEAQEANAKARTTEETVTKTLTEQFNAQMKGVSDALGLTKPDEAPDPAKLAAQLADTQAAQNNLARDNAVLRYAATAGANADLLLDSKTFEKTLDGVNPGDAEAVKGKITEWVQKNPQYRIKQADPGSGTGGAGTGGSSDTPRPATLEQAMAAAVKAQRQ